MANPQFRYDEAEAADIVAGLGGSVPTTMHVFNVKGSSTEVGSVPVDLGGYWVRHLEEAADSYLQSVAYGHSLKIGQKSNDARKRLASEARSLALDLRRVGRQFDLPEHLNDLYRASGASDFVLWLATEFTSGRVPRHVFIASIAKLAATELAGEIEAKGTVDQEYLDGRDRKHRGNYLRMVFVPWQLMHPETVDGDFRLSEGADALRYLRVATDRVLALAGENISEDRHFAEMMNDVLAG